ncbi:MAG: hypothetical protein ACREQT_05740, partial [Candidatus Binataceae bacterium]
MSALPKPLTLDLVVPRAGLLAGLGEEWRVARWPARLSVICLLIFYLFAVASPPIAPYDPAYQYRNLPDCPPMGLHLSRGADRAQGWLFAYPLQMVDPLARRFAEDRTRKTFIRFFYRGHLFTTVDASMPFFLLGSEGLGRDLFSRIVYGARVSMSIGLVGVLISFSLGI